MQKKPESLLEKELQSLPNTPGVYQFFNAQNKLLYVGKAKDLKKRVRSYFAFSPSLHASSKNSLRIQKMIAEAVHLEFINTSSEADALILENSFIKQLHPKYNILLRDDKTYPYIYIDFEEDFARFKITRKIIKKPKIKYFGPFFKGAKALLDALYFYYPLKQKQSCDKPCIFYQISRCLAPCAGLISKAEYEKILQRATKALLNPSILIKNLEHSMLELAKNENYEEAAKLRDQIATIKDLEVKIELDIARLEDFDIFALAFENELLCTLRFVIQDGKIISVYHRLSSLKEFDKNEAYKQFILESFSIDTPLSSNKIFIYEDFEDRQVLQDLLCQRFEKKISINAPKIGEKRKICDLAFQNAKQMIKNQSKDKESSLLNELRSYFELEHLPQRIEVFDNSHMQGRAIVGAMIVYEKGFQKAAYRHFHLNHNNDYEQMKELLTKRAMNFEKNPAPDLWLIDGGKTLLKLADEIAKSSGANIDILAISKEKIDAKAHRAKGFARDKIHSLRGEFSLSVQDERLLFLQKLRDEAHRFAISFHQHTKKKQDLQSSKLKGLGLSEGVLQKLLAYFGDFENIYKADFKELEALCGSKNASKIKNLV
ncbi:excinuclease ABC subunit C [Campylobacter sp. MIT 99-7217]|uniref:excinuclease ABC subunit UvrC n=1 Tax=Campylobacter sp. MIT 99-7217 TaxID=535091 RepID=UPI00115968B4|nr:excinuclease ABC subunit UvrC [Campylobacter sp. MIT 99-7217]TQR31924.1 excinuclease ABC subunit C [Campylobacter sp. MIT 99-7217]